MKSAEQILDEEEGYSATIYLDTKDKWTVGKGFLVEPGSAGLSELECDIIVKLRVAKLREVLSGRYIWFELLTKQRQNVIICMAYQMGLGGLDSFRKMKRAISTDNYDLVAREMLDSKWAREYSPGRAKRMADLMVKG